jgi:anaerobic magnesium-protoporphyrin IX monomethyl ester cyclase
LQFGYPSETREDISRTLQMVRDCRPDDIGMSVSYPLPGTKFHDAVWQQLGDRQNWVDSSDLAMLYRGPFPTAFYRQLHVVLHKEFRARKAWDDVWAAVRRPGTLRRRHLRRLAAVAFYRSTLLPARVRLARLASAPHDGLKPPPAASQDPSVPTPQPDRGARVEC